MHGSDGNEGLREALEAQHSFPGVFVFKLVGQGADFAASAEGALRCCLALSAGEDSGAAIEATTRKSRTGKYISVSLRTKVVDVDQVLAIYKELQALPGLSWIA